MTDAEKVSDALAYEAAERSFRGCLPMNKADEELLKKAVLAGEPNPFDRKSVIDNPIPSNVDLLTIERVKQCASHLSWLYESLDRYDAMRESADKSAFLHNILYHVRQSRDQFNRDWAA